MTSFPKTLEQKNKNIELSFASVYVGVDAGGTKIEVTLINKDKEVIYSSNVDLPANPAKIKKSQAIANLVSAIAKTFEAAILSMQNIESIVIGLAGVDDENSRVEIKNQITIAFSKMVDTNIQIEVLTDSEVALLSVTEGIKAVVIIAGTGAIVKGKNEEGKVSVADGWGDLFGDKGSAMWISQKALERVFAAYDGREDPADKLTKAILNYVNVSDVEALIPYFYSERENSIKKIAGIAKIVYDVAKTGDPIAREILKNAGKELAASAIAVIKKLDLTNQTFPIGLVGSVFQAKEFVIEPLMEEITSFARNAEFTELKYKPSIAASLRALEITEYPFLKA